MYLRSRLALSFLAAALLTVVLASYFFSREARKLVLENYLDGLRETGHLLSPEIQRTYLNDPEQIDAAVDRLAHGLDTRLTVIDASGRVIGDSQRSGADLRNMENHRDRPEIAAASGGQTGNATRVSATLGIAFLYLAQPIWSDGRVVGVFRLAVPLVKIGELQTLRLRFLAAGSAAVLAATLLVAAFLGAWFTRPMRHLQATADRIARGETAPVDKAGFAAPGTGELADLAFTMEKISTSLHQTIKRLRVDQEVQAAIVSALQDGVLALDRQGTIVVANARAGALLGLADAPVGRDVFELWRHPEATALLSGLLAGRPGETEITLNRPGGGTLRLTAIPLTSPEAPIAGLVAVADISAQVATLQMRRDFFNNASHELRTPLTSIIGYLETLEDSLPPDSPLRSQYLAVLVRQADRMRRIVDDLLTLAQVESEQWPVNAENYDLTAQVKQQIEMFEPAASQQAQAIAMIAPDQPVRVRADREKIYIALSNLIDNAVKYAGPGARIEVRLESGDEKARITVADDGPGIPKEQAGRIFERFYRLDKSRSRSLGGTGLGLSIVRHILAAHREEIVVETELGSGVRFTFSLPLASA